MVAETVPSFNNLTFMKHYAFRTMAYPGSFLLKVQRIIKYELPLVIEVKPLGHMSLKAWQDSLLR